MPRFAELAVDPDATLDVLGLAMAAEFREVDQAAAMAPRRVSTPSARGCGELPSRRAGRQRRMHSHAGRRLASRTGSRARSRAATTRPDNSMLDLVLARPARPSDPAVRGVHRGRSPSGDPSSRGVGLPGHFVVGHFGADPPLLMDPFAAGRAPSRRRRPAATSCDHGAAHEIATADAQQPRSRPISRRGDLGAAIHAARMRLMLPADDVAPRACRSRPSSEPCKRDSTDRHPVSDEPLCRRGRRWPSATPAEPKSEALLG